MSRRISEEVSQLSRNYNSGFGKADTGVNAENIRAGHSRAVDDLEVTQHNLIETRSKTERMKEAAALLLENNVEIGEDITKSANFQKLYKLEKESGDLDSTRKAALWDASQHYTRHELEYRIAAVNEAAEQGISINTEIDGVPVMPIEQAVASAQYAGKTIEYGGETHHPLPVFR